MALGKRVKQRREEIHIEQVDLANYIGVSQASISALENRDSRSSRNTSKLAKALDVTEYWLETGENPKYPAGTTSDRVHKESAAYTGSKTNIKRIYFKTWSTIADDTSTNPEYIDVMFPIDMEISQNAFALEYKKQTPDWKDDYILIFDSETEELSKYFCCKLKNEKTASLKILTSEGDQVYYLPADQRLKSEPIHQNEFSLSVPMVYRVSPPYSHGQ